VAGVSSGEIHRGSYHAQRVEEQEMDSVP
jgi:hypothetical protein